ncbi:MAG: nitrilase-related carbon-nitrogen hydrolase [Planctomycetota bacterium]
MTDSSSAMGPRSPLRPAARFACVALTWGLIALAQPGVLRPDGFGHLGFLAIGAWAWAARRPGRRAFLVEWAGHSLGLASVFAWMIEFMPAILAPMSIVPALYPALAGVLLRRAGAWPLALLAPAAWVAAEVVRWTLPVPLSFGWFRLGLLAHDTHWLVGSAAWFGTWGLSWALAAMGGLSADAVEAFRRSSWPRGPLLASLAFGLGPVAALTVLSALPLEKYEDGPDVLVVQTGIEQEVKAARRDPLEDLFVPQVSRTLEAIHALDDSGAPLPPPDVVMWGETFLPGKLAPPAVVEAYRRGARPAEWALSRPLASREIEFMDLYARDLAGALLGTSTMRALSPPIWRRLFERDPPVEWADRVAAGERLLPLGTSFLSGVEAWTVVREDDGKEALRSLNGVVVWAPDGSTSEIAAKVHVVPGGETGEPLRWFPFVLDAIRRVASAIPDFVPAEETAILKLPARDGEAYSAGIAVCYDNAFDDVFAAPIQRDPVDLFVVVSNEAWYGASAEMDHMLAFTRIAAAAAQRSIVRATNSGISAIVGPDGRVRDLLQAPDGRRKMIAGTLRGRVPVPASAGSARITFFASTHAAQPAAWGGLGLLILLAGAALRGRGTARGAESRESIGNRAADLP